MGKHEKVGASVFVSFMRTPGFLTLLETTSRGACVGTDPRAHDAFEGELALRALSNCARCTVVGECLEVVMPRSSWFTGVAGGKVWREGRERV